MNQPVQRFRKVRLVWSIAILIALAVPVLGQEESDPWLILTNGKKGSINARTTREDLVRRYGAANVVDRDVDDGEGSMDSVTVIFPDDPGRTIEILWQNLEKKANPSEVRISGKESRWHAVHHISLGTSYSELERINGKPFPVSQGTDQGNVVLSWKGGVLDKDLKDGGAVFLWLDDAPSNKTTQHGAPPTVGRAPDAAKGNKDRLVNRITWKFSDLPQS